MSIDPAWENQATRPLLEFVLQEAPPDPDSSLIGEFYEWDRWEHLENAPAPDLAQLAFDGLLKHGLLIVADDEFRVSDRGRRFLSGELSATAIEQEE